jgi:predicted amidohydrolase YtcJ
MRSVRGISASGELHTARSQPSRCLRYTDPVKLSQVCLAGAMLVASHSGAADRLFINGEVHTPEGVVRESILVRDGRIVALTPQAETTTTAAPGTEIVDLAGAHVLPGLMDAHLHLTAYGTSLEQVDLTGARSWEEVVQRVVRFAAGRSPNEWIEGRGWDQNLWPRGAFPDRAALDRAFSDRAVLLRRVDGHAVVANGKALQLAGIGRTTPDPPGGRILRRSDGEPSGVLVDNAVGLVTRMVPKPGAAVIERRILTACHALARFGLTQIDDAGTTEDQLSVLRSLDGSQRLPIRVYVLLDGSDPDLLARELARPPNWGGPAMLRIGGVKLYADGALGSRGALLGADYSDDPGNRGLAVMSAEALTAAVRRAAAARYQVAIHAIGDEAVHRALNAFAGLDPRWNVRLRHRIEHSQIVRPEDVKRFAASQVIASIQPTHCTSDMPWAPQRLGPKRIAWAYRWRSLLDADAELAGGSDAPVESPDPKLGLYAARTRKRPDGTPAGGWNPGERLRPSEALALFTTGAAVAGHAERWSGSIVKGAAADLTVVDIDPERAPPERLLHMKILRTVVAGRDVFVADGAARSGGAR